MFSFIGKDSNQRFINSKAMGAVIAKDNAISSKYSFENIEMIEIKLAPTIFRMPISFLRCESVREHKPNSPRQETTIVRMLKMVKRATAFSSVMYWVASASSRNE